MSGERRLGEYLKARRGLLGPREAGLTDHGRRRVTGLRREEVALLAAQRPPESVPPGIRQLVTSRSDVPMFVQGRYLDVLFANPLATALNPAYHEGGNLLKSTFLDPAVRDLHDDWEDAAGSLVASIRAQADTATDDPHLAQLVGDLAVHSPQFARLWARHDVRPRTSGTSLLHHPQIGSFTLRFEKLAVTGAPGQLVVIYHAGGAESADALVLLGHLAAQLEPTTRENGRQPA